MADICCVARAAYSPTSPQYSPTSPGRALLTHPALLRELFPWIGRCRCATDLTIPCALCSVFTHEPSIQPHVARQSFFNAPLLRKVLTCLQVLMR